MPKIINQDIIDKIAEYARKGYSKSATARELGIDRTTVNKYWPNQRESSEEKEENEAGHKLSIEEEFHLLHKKAETDHELDSLLNKIGNREWETESLKARGKAIIASIDFLKGKLGEMESVMEVDKICALVTEVKSNATSLLDEDEPLHKQREEKEKKKREEDLARRNELERSLIEARLRELAWVFPCKRDYARKIMDRFIWEEDVNGDVDSIRSLYRIGSLLVIAEDLEWGGDTRELKPLTNECLNLLKGNWEEIERIISIAYERKKQILIPTDEDMEKKYSQLVDLLTGEISERSVEMVFKFNAALGRLADERFLDKDELLEDSGTRP